MKKFLILDYSSASAAEQMTNASPEQAKAGMDAWMAWAKRAGSVIVDLGNSLGHATQVSPFRAAGSDSGVSGYSMLQAESMNAVQDLLKNQSAAELGDGLRLTQRTQPSSGKYKPRERNPLLEEYARHRVL